MRGALLFCGGLMCACLLGGWAGVLGFLCGGLLEGEGGGGVGV